MGNRSRRVAAVPCGLSLKLAPLLGRCAGRSIPLAFIVLSCGVAAAQSTNASLSGRVVDPSKAAVPGATIAAIRTDTNVRQQATSGDSGTYALTNLAPGPYQIEVEKTGFKKVIRPNVVLHVLDALTLDVEMSVGSVSETVSVEGGEPLVNSRSGTVSTTVDRTFVSNLPLNGRSFQSLITATPGVVLTPAGASSPGQFSVNGQRSDANYFMVDGASANVGVQPTSALGPAGAGASPGLSAQGGTQSLVSVDALQEFKIQSSSYAPEFGRTPGGQISMVTRSGSNQPHGSLFEYFRNDALDSPDYFVKSQGLSKPKEHQHDFGGVFGGPLQRDRTFVFVSYEGLRLDQPKSAVTDVPSLASRLAASEAVRPILAAFPLPNGPETANDLARFSASYTDPSSLDAASVRVDHTFGPPLTVFARYNFAPSHASSRLGTAASSSVNTRGHVQNQLQTLTSGGTWILSPTASNELRVNWSRNAGMSFQSVDAFGGAVVPPATMLHPTFAPGTSDYRVTLGAANVFWDDGPLSSNVQRQVNIVDTMLLAKRSHQVKAGVDYRRLLPIFGPVQYVQVYIFPGVSGVLAGTPTAVITASSSSSNRASHGTSISAYAQDAWSPSSRVTLTYGVRWEFDPPPALNDSRDAVTLTATPPAQIAAAPAGTPMYRTTFTNFAPRLGAAYRLRDTAARETVLRGGWGVFFDLPGSAVINNLTGFPFTATRTLAGVAFPVDSALLSPPRPTPGGSASYLAAADPDLTLPYSYQWNVALEQALGASSTVSVSYVGARGRRLLAVERFLNPTSQFQVLDLGTNDGRSRYDSLQVKYTHRLSNGLQALASYTLASSKDNVSSDGFPVLPTFRADPDQDWGPSDFDVRHSFSAAVTYAIPAPRVGQAWRWVVTGWSADSIVQCRSALPVNVVTGTTAFAVSNALRPDVVSGTAFYVADPTAAGGLRLNRLAFASPPLDATGSPLRQGNLGRNALRGFAMSQVDVAVHRDIPISRVMRAQLRVESFNLLNRVNLGAPVNTLTSGLFGRATATLASSYTGPGVAGGGLSALYQVGGPRSIQLAVRFQF
jgi:hypothetical protein